MREEYLESNVGSSIALRNIRVSTLSNALWQSANAKCMGTLYPVVITITVFVDVEWY